MNPKRTILLAVIAWVAAATTSPAQTYYLSGYFNGWSENVMTAGPNAGEYTYTITGGFPGTYDQCKVTDGNNNWWPSVNLEFLYDSTGSATIHFWPGNSIDGWWPSANRVGYDDPDLDPGWGLAGDFDGWDGTQALLAPIGNGVYSNSIVVASAGTFGFKFQSPGGSWGGINFASPDFGNGNGNGSYQTTQPNQTLPVVLDLPNGRYYIGAPALPATVTFQLDMSEQVAFGNFINTDLNPSDPDFGQPVNSVAVGGFNGDWGTDLQLTNYAILHPEDNNPGLKTNLYIGTFTTTQPYLPITFQWKFRVNNLDGSYEEPISTSGLNRSTTLTQQNTVLPVTSYGDEGLHDIFPSNSILVTFSIYCTNGTLDNTGYAFQKGVDAVYISGSWLGWPTWGFFNLPASQQMVEVGASDVYTNSFVIPRGNSIHMFYKYSFNGVDDENGWNTNHVREIRSYGPIYTFPQDVWSGTVLQPGTGNFYPLAGLASTNIVEPDFGYLAIGALSGLNNFPITWLGRPGVLLQYDSRLVGGTWTNVTASDGTQSTNWPNAGGTQFFRLMKE